MSDTYAKTPITEAVIEVRVVEPVRDAQLARAEKLLKRRYPKSETLTEYRLVVGSLDAPSSTLQGYKLTSDTAEFVAIARKTGLVFAALAPYPGWTKFTEEFEANFKIWSKVVGRVRIERVGVRFMNRIDIPLKEGDMILSEDYLTVGVDLPKSTMNGALGWQSSALSDLVGTPFKLRMTTGTVDSPLIEHASFLLDLDLICDVEVPQGHDDIWALLALARDVKNRVFEECITDLTRELIK